MKKVVVCWDGSDGAKRALKAAERLVDANVGEVFLLHVAEVFHPRGPDGQPLPKHEGVLETLAMVNPMEQELQHVNDVTEREKATKAHKEFEKLAESETKERFTYINKEASSARETICKEVGTMGDVDLVVTGTRGLGFFSKLTLGSVSEHVLHNAPCPVMIVR